MIFADLKQLPEKWRCRLCRRKKSIFAMIVVRRRKDGKILLRPRCKDCHNATERGHRREWKNNYQRTWRKYNADLNRSYWKKRDPKEAARASARFQRRNFHALAIQRRLRNRFDLHVSVAEARALLEKYGPCYPSRYGLTPRGLRECERIRSRMRAAGNPLPLAEIRLMVYEDGFFIRPSRQPIPYQASAENLRRWHAAKKAAQNTESPKRPRSA